MCSQLAQIKNSSGSNMCAARIHDYGSPLIIEEIERPVISTSEEVVIKVGAAGLCHSDLHLIAGDWKKNLPIDLPKIPGHEIAGWVEETGSAVSESILKKGDFVAVFGGWGCGSCIYCKRGDEQMCKRPIWPGLSVHNGGFSEYVLVPSYRFLVKIDGDNNLRPEEIAPLTDAGLTPYRAIKKIRHLIVPGKYVGIIGIGGLGSYAVQYAKMLGFGANIVAIDRRDDKLELGAKLGADFTINFEKTSDLRSAVKKITNSNGFDVVLDTVGLASTFNLAIENLNRNGAIVMVGLFGQKTELPIFDTVIKEFQIYGSLWGNYNELREVIELAKKGMIRHHLSKFRLSNVNDAIKLLKNGDIVGRAVVIP